MFIDLNVCVYVHMYVCVCASLYVSAFFHLWNEVIWWGVEFSLLRKIQFTIHFTPFRHSVTLARSSNTNQNERRQSKWWSPYHCKKMTDFQTTWKSYSLKHLIRLSFTLVPLQCPVGTFSKVNHSYLQVCSFCFHFTFSFS